jgi:proline dehydrogenase
MPGETVDEALDAGRALARQGIGCILTRLGENLTDISEADETAAHYLDVIHRIHDAGLDGQVSVKLTQLGLDRSVERCHEHLVALVRAADAAGQTLWIDMESSAYVDATIEVYRRARAVSPRVGIALQAYLRRTPSDVESLLSLGPAIRLVKGAYLEPATLALPRKADVDLQYFQLACRLLDAATDGAATGVTVATHDRSLVARLQHEARTRHVPRERMEFAMLYGIQRGLQQSIARDGWPLRILISYGSSWFPWFMRRLAERPANLWFVVKNVVG